MKSYREIALLYHYKIDEQIADRILVSIDISDMGGYTIDELCFLSSLNIPVFEYHITTPYQLNEHLIKVGKSVYVDYIANRIANTWNSFFKRIKNNEERN